jgi:hypothetical protein
VFGASPDSDAVTGRLAVPDPALPDGSGAICPNAVVVPYSNT